MAVVVRPFQAAEVGGCPGPALGELVGHEGAGGDHRADDQPQDQPEEHPPGRAPLGPVEPDWLDRFRNDGHDSTAAGASLWPGP